MSFSSIERTPREAPAERSLREGRLKLEFRSDPDGRTHVADQHAGYPFHLGRALYLDGDAPGMATVYIQSTAGGLFAGDRQRIDITARTGARAHVTTQAATIVHRTAPDRAGQFVALSAAAGAYLEYMPDATILFPGATLSSTLDVTIDDDATVTIGESYIGHDPDGEDTPFEALESTLRIVDWAGRLLALDRYAVTGVEIAARRIGVTGGHGAHGTFAVIDRGARRGAFGGCLERRPRRAGRNRLRRRLDACQRLRRLGPDHRQRRRRVERRHARAVERRAPRADRTSSRTAAQVNLLTITPGKEDDGCCCPRPRWNG